MFDSDEPSDKYGVSAKKRIKTYNTAFGSVRDNQRSAGWDRDAHVIDESSIFGGRLLQTGLNTPLSKCGTQQNARPDARDEHVSGADLDDNCDEMLAIKPFVIAANAKEPLTEKRKRRTLKKRPR